MLRGHVDVISETEISGWAFDDATPLEQPSIALFVDGKRLATIPCDQPREPRQGVDALGHAFAYRFDPPLATTSTPRRVTVRFAHNGNLLPNGDAILPSHARVVPPDLNVRPPASAFQVPAPTTAREVFDLLSLHDPKQGLYNLLQQLDYAVPVEKKLDYATVLRGLRMPAPPRTWTPQAAKDRLYDALMTLEFQQQVIAKILRAYPDKRRHLFIHIPKCAGSDLSYYMTRRYPSFDRRLATPAVTPPTDLIDGLARLVRTLPFSDDIFVQGHVNLRYYEMHDLIRPEDEAFAILRDPIGIAISHINYILTRFRNDAKVGTARPDTRGWLRVLGLSFDPEMLLGMDAVSLAHTILREPRIILHNHMCFWLGGGSAEVVLERLAKCAVELTTIKSYEPWLASRWGIDQSARRNESQKFISAQSLPADDLDYLHRISEEDTKLYQHVAERLRVAGGDSIRIG